jgi:hypothetical protein
VGGTRFKPPKKIEKGGFSLVESPGRPVIEEEPLAGQPAPQQPAININEPGKKNKMGRVLQ